MRCEWLYRYLPAFLIGAVLVGCSASHGQPRVAGSSPSARVFLVHPRYYRQHEPVTVRAILANVGDTPLMYAETHPRLDWAWEVTDDNGSPLSTGKRLPTIAIHTRTEELSPGAAVLVTFNLRELFDLPRGRYAVSAGRRVWQPIGAHPTDIRSAVFPFRVVD